MTVKEQVVAILEQNRNQYISGETIANELTVSRAAVWKAIKKLTDEGFQIEAVTNRGYRLMEMTDVLSKEGIEQVLRKKITKEGKHYLENICIDYRKAVSSTNMLMKDMVQKQEGYILVAASQTDGIGRLGRSFESPDKTGIYFSILLKPKCSPQEMSLLTVVAGVACCEAIEKLTGQAPQIKWVNDIFLNGRKIAGILTQASVSMEDFLPEYAIVGIGLNVYEPFDGFADSIKQIAGALCEQNESNIKNQLLVEILDRFFYYYEHFDEKLFLPEYRNRSLVIGKEIFVIKQDERKHARAVSIDDMCHLLVEYPDHTREALVAGEISIRPIN